MAATGNLSVLVLPVTVHPRARSTVESNSPGPARAIKADSEFRVVHCHAVLRAQDRPFRAGNYLGNGSLTAMASGGPRLRRVVLGRSSFRTVPQAHSSSRGSPIALALWAFGTLGLSASSVCTVGILPSPFVSMTPRLTASSTRVLLSRPLLVLIGLVT